MFLLNTAGTDKSRVSAIVVFPTHIVSAQEQCKIHCLHQPYTMLAQTGTEQEPLFMLPAHIDSGTREESERTHQL